jgi:hypothetical protein
MNYATVKSQPGPGLWTADVRKLLASSLTTLIGTMNVSALKSGKENPKMFAIVHDLLAESPTLESKGVIKEMLKKIKNK